MEPLPTTYHQDMAQRVYTPRKEPPPSLSYGSSSSPVFESPPTVGKELRFMHWSPTQNRVKKSQAPQLLPSYFPPSHFGTIPSSPPEPNNRHSSIDDGASPRPRRSVRAHYQEAESRPAYTRMKRRADGDFDGSPTKSVSNKYTPTLPSGHIKKPNLLSSKAFARACAGRRNRRQVARPQRRLGVDSRPSPRGDSAFGPEFEPVQEQFPSRGLGLSFIIDLNGKANVNPLRLTSSTPATPVTPATPQSRHAHSTDATNMLMTPHTRQTVNEILDEESDLESDGEFEENTDRLAITQEVATRTPPRFASLGNCDAAAAFARTLARSRELGKGSMFLFPPAGSPRKPADMALYTPFMPETPRRGAATDSSYLEYGMQTPPNTFYSFDASGGYYATGMTPYLSTGRAHEVNI